MSDDLPTMKMVFIPEENNKIFCELDIVIETIDTCIKHGASLEVLKEVMQRHAVMFEAHLMTMPEPEEGL